MSGVEEGQELAIGVDVGGTKVAAGLVSARGEILDQMRTPMVSNDGPERALATVTSLIHALTEKASSALGAQAKLRGIGVCSPGPLDPISGVVLNPPNLPCWRNFPLGDQIAHIHGVAAKIDNDGNAAGLAEALWGAGRGYRNVFYTTVGTGIGTGILFDGHIYHGRTGAAAEGGHMTIDRHGPRCGCGKLGCIEALASGPAIAGRARAKIASGRKSSLLDLAAGDPEKISGVLVGQACASGDAVAVETMQETVDLLAIWLGNIVDLLEPDVMIVGGGVVDLLRPLFGEIRDRLPGHSVNLRCHEIPLVAAHYGQDAGVAGGAALCFEEPRRKEAIGVESSQPPIPAKK